MPYSQDCKEQDDPAGRLWPEALRKPEEQQCVICPACTASLVWCLHCSYASRPREGCGTGTCEGHGGI